MNKKRKVDGIFHWHVIASSYMIRHELTGPAFIRFQVQNFLFKSV